MRPPYRAYAPRLPRRAAPRGSAREIISPALEAASVILTDTDAPTNREVLDRLGALVNMAPDVWITRSLPAKPLRDLPSTGPASR